MRTVAAGRARAVPPGLRHLRWQVRRQARATVWNTVRHGGACGTRCRDLERRARAQRSSRHLGFRHGAKSGRDYDVSSHRPIMLRPAHRTLVAKLLCNLLFFPTSPRLWAQDQQCRDQMDGATALWRTIRRMALLGCRHPQPRHQWTVRSWIRRDPRTSNGPVPKNLKDVRDRRYGCGPPGASVQDSVTGAFSDRDIVKQTLLGGRPMLEAKDECDRMRAKVGQDTKRKALAQPIWRAVLAAAAREIDIFRLDGEDRELKLLLKAVPTDPLGKVQYHNELMAVYGMELRELIDAMKMAKGKANDQVQRRAPTALLAETRSRSRSPR